MAWSIAEVARMSKVTSRTLRHYDEIGLLPLGMDQEQRAPLLRGGRSAAVAADPADAGTGPGAARDPGGPGRSRLDQVAVLREHRQRLLAERDRLETLACTVGRTIAELEEGKDKGHMTKINRPENLFEGFQPPPRPRPTYGSGGRRSGSSPGRPSRR